MTHRESRDHNRTRRSARNIYARLRDQRRRKDRQLLSETLEPRQLLAGPDLIGVQPNEGSLINGGEILNVSPREIVFRFDDNTELDPATLSGIRITRAGADGVFESAIAASDLGTGGRALVEFRAIESGVLGNGIEVNFLSSSRSGSAVPIVSVSDRTVTIDVNSNPANPTRVQSLIFALADHPVAKDFVEAISVSGSLQTPVGTTIPNGLSLLLDGANAAEATTDFGTGSEVSVRFVSRLPGAIGLGTEIAIERRNFGGSANPLVLVTGQSILVQINSSLGNESTVQDLIDAIERNPESDALVSVSSQGGDLTTQLGVGTTPLPVLTLTGVTDVVVEPGFVGLGDSSREVVFRFAEPLPDDLYQIDVLGSGQDALSNIDGELFNDGSDETRQFRVDLGPKILAVVPEPIRRDASGQLVPQVGKIEVYFNDDTLDPLDAVNPDFYQLIFTKDTLSNIDDVIVPLQPGAVSYNATANMVTLDYGQPLSRIREGGTGPFLTGAARLRIGTSDSLPAAPTEIVIPTDPADTFVDATTLMIGSDTMNSVHLRGEIVNTEVFGLTLPGPDLPGAREIRADDPSRLERTIPLDVLTGTADSDPGITVIRYDFPESWQGDDPTRTGIDELRTYFNLITEQQKDRVREVLSLFSDYLGVQFVETTGAAAGAATISIASGELYGADPSVQSASAVFNSDGTVNTDAPESITVARRDRNQDGIDDLAVLDFQDFDDSDDDELGGEFFRGAFLAVGQLLGYGVADYLPQPVTQSTQSVLSASTDSEPAFPSVADIVNGQFMFRPESTDIDLYRFQLSEPGRVSIEVTAERLEQASLLDASLRLYRQTPSGQFEEIAANDDYFSNDSLIELELEANVDYFVGVSASGNSTYDPQIPGSGFGGRSEGAYELIATFDPLIRDLLTDTHGNPLDGDSDGRPGGTFNYWFVPADPNRTVYVDKAAAVSGTGTIDRPYREVDQAIAAVVPGDTIRVVGNGGVDGNVGTADDNFAYQIGRDNRGIALEDGADLNVPKGVNLVIEAGAVFKMRRSRIGIGSTAPLVDHSNASLQVLGTPTILDASGLPVLGEDGMPVLGSVIFTSFNDNLDSDQPDSAAAGDWGGIDFHGDLDSADESRINLEDEGVFLNHVQFIDLRYGGGQVSIDGRQTVVSPIDMAITRPTIIHSQITLSADAAMAATPDTFKESRFGDTTFTADYLRIGPHIRGNTVVENTINGLFVRVTTRTGDVLQPLTVAARMDDTDITHVLTENLIIQGTPGGPVAVVDAPSSLLIRANALPGTADGNIQAGSYVYRISYVDAGGAETAGSDPTAPAELVDTGSIVLTGLPTVPANTSFVSRRLYRAPVASDGSIGQFLRVAELNSSDNSYVDSLLIGSGELPDVAATVIARTDAGLKLDPGTILKLSSARIDVTLDGHLYAEGTVNNPVIMTSLNDIRYGAGGTFDTNSTSNTSELSHGDWAGVYVGFGGQASFDNAVIAGGGGTSRILGGFASFNVIEVHQGDLRIANSRFESNADGQGFVNSENEPNRGGHSTNASGTVFVRAAQPTIVSNDFVDGHGPAATFDVNSMTFAEVVDQGRSTGPLNAVYSSGNSGPLILGNRISANPDDPDLPDDVDPFGLNGIEVRGGAVATEVVLDDVDVVHIVRESIEIPNKFVFGGLRLESDARGSLVIKFQGETAGIVAGGALATAEDQFQDIADRIGGSLQIIGHPDFPVVLTALVDDTIGAGFTPEGNAAVDTNANGIRTTILTSETAGEPTPPGLPLGPEYDRTDREVNNGTIIDNDIDPNVIGFFEADVNDGAEVDTIFVTGIDQNTGTRLDQQNFEFLLTTIVDIDLDPAFENVEPFRLIDSDNITRVATLFDDDRVISEGSFGPFANDDRVYQWSAETFILDNRSVIYTTLNFESEDGRDFNAGIVRHIDVISYLDSGAGADDQDTLYSVGTPGEQDFRAYTIDNQNRIGFSHGGIYANDGSNQLNATYLGWNADEASRLLATINAENTSPTIEGDIDVPELVDDPLFTDANAAYGIDDVGTSFQWRLDPDQERGRVTSFVEWIPSDPANPFPISLPQNVDGTGSWDGVTIREAASDRNVSITAENEPRGIAINSDTNPIPGQAQFLGELASSDRAGDENRRLGFIVDGSISQPSDIDVYSFIGEAGTNVWLDIDRTDAKLDTVIELIDANGNTLILSDDSIAESDGTMQRLTDLGGRFDAANAGALNQLPSADPTLTTADHQDAYSTNRRDAGMRIILPGEIGQRNLYHVRVRSSSVASGSNVSLRVGGQTQTGDPTSSLRQGLTAGAYQLQLRLRGTDENPGTQLRFSDVRFAVNGVQVIGGPLHSPLSADEYEINGPNDTLSNAQPLGLYAIDSDFEDTPLLDDNGDPVLDDNGDPVIQRVYPPHGPLSSDRLSKSIGGVIDSAADVDWYRFEIEYDDLQRDEAALYLSTVFDLDYADGLARSDTAIYVFDASGALVLRGTDSNVSDDQPLSTADFSDLSRGSFGTGDPFIGASELSEGIYFVAVSNQSRVPQELDQFFSATTANPSVRLEPIDSVTRIAEDRIDSFGGGTADDPLFPILFDDNSIVPYTLDDVVLYVNTGSDLHLVNPFTGQDYGVVGDFIGGDGGEELREIAFRDNGELFAYNVPFGIIDDTSLEYFRIDTGTGALSGPLTQGAGLTTFEATVTVNDPDPNTYTPVAANSGMDVEAIAIASLNNNERAFFVGNRAPLTAIAFDAGADYDQNILYQFDPADGNVVGTNVDFVAGPAGTALSGAATGLREVGQIGGLNFGELVTGVDVVGNDLYGVTNQGRLVRVFGGQLGSFGARSIGGPVAAPQLEAEGLNFTALRSGPTSYSDGELRDTLFGITGNGNIYAFDTSGELQPVFAGGASMISTGIGDARGLDFSILGFNLWHTTSTRGEDDGHGINALANGVRSAVQGGNSLAFNYEVSAHNRNYPIGERPVVLNSDGTIANPRQDEAQLEASFNMPGGARGVVQSNVFSLEGYVAADQPVLYFNYLLDADEPESQDTLRVFVINADGSQHLVASNNLSVVNPLPDEDFSGLFDDEFDDPPPIGQYDDDIDVDTQQLYDSTGSWRQARVPLGEFAGERNLSLRIEFATAGTFATNSQTLRLLPGSALVDGDTFEISGETFSIDLHPSVSVPTGGQLAALYEGNTDPALVVIDGQTYALDDGNRTISSDQVAVPLLDAFPLGTTLNDLSSSQIADALGTSISLSPPTSVLVSGLSFADAQDADPTAIGGRNDVIDSAVPLAYTSGRASFIGQGQLGNDANAGDFEDVVNPVLLDPTNLDDVDLLSLNVEAGTMISVNLAQVGDIPISSSIRFFLQNGVELSSETEGLNSASIVIDEPGQVFIGISGTPNTAYDPVTGLDVQSGAFGKYEATISVSPQLSVLTGGNLVELGGLSTVNASPASLFEIGGDAVITGTPVPVSRFMSANEVATVVQSVLADELGGGNSSAFPITGSTITIQSSEVDDPGPFVNESNRWGDQFGAGPLAGARDNDFEGVYLDDFIIGFAERGEVVTSSNPIAQTETFIEDESHLITNPPQPVQSTVTGTYQLEIRDASEYVQSDIGVQFRTFDTNDRLSEGVSITVPAATELVDGASFTIADIKSELAFEFDLLDLGGTSDGVDGSAARVPIRISATATSHEVANAIITALKSSSVQQVLDVDASGANGNAGFLPSLVEQIASDGDDRINIYGNVIVNDTDNSFVNVNDADLRGDDNRKSDEQGIILIENSRFLFNADAGIDINRSAETRVQGVDQTDLSPSALVYPRNLVELNTKRFLPGVVVQSNVLGFNANAGIRISGIAVDRATETALTPTLADTVAFDRIINNTIVGGNVNRPEETFPDVFADVLFENGDVSFADEVVSFVKGADVTPGFDDATHALGVPDCTGRGAEPATGEFTTSLGTGGVLTLAFTDNFLTGSGDARPDLMVFETGEIEAVGVSVSRDGIDFIDVGIVAGIAQTVDLDEFGFDAQDRFGFVRLIDLGQGTSTSGPVGADIDAVGALSTVAADIYVPGSQGIVVRQGAAPTVLNNVLANLQTAIAVSPTSSQTVIGATTYYRNSTDAANDQPEARGLFAQQVIDAQEIFIDPVQLVFTPRAGTPIIDSSIDSLEDRSTLLTVRGAVGLPPSPIIAPSMDVNGQLRVDDPEVETPGGIGERVFKDRGGEDRADQVGPRAVLVSPQAPDIGLNGGEVTTAQGTVFDSFDIQLIDGIAPADPTPGVGIDDASINSDTILVSRDGINLVEGQDYRFGYDPSNNVVRLTPLAGIWQDDSVYVIRLLDSGDAVLRASAGDQYTDGELTTAIGLDSSFTTLEVEAGINIVISNNLFGDSIDQQAITVFDGSNEFTFEFDTDNLFPFSSIPVTVPSTASVPQLAAALADAINVSGLRLQAISLGNRIQLLGDSTLASAVPLTDAITVTVTEIDVVVSTDLVGVPDGETVTISDGFNSIEFEYDSDGVQNNVLSVLVPVLDSDSTRQLAEALDAQIQASGLDVISRVVDNRVEVIADSPFATALTSSDAILIGLEISGPSIGTSPGFGIRIPNNGFLPADSVEDGQTFVIQRGQLLSQTFELDFGGGIEDPESIAVQIGSNVSLDGIADALVRAIGGAGLGLDPENIGDGRVTLGGDANYILDLSQTALEPTAAAGRDATIPVVIPIDATLDEVAELYRTAILGIGQPGVSIEIVGDRLIADGLANFTGTGAVRLPIVRDDVGNLLQSNQANGRTELTIFVGGGFDYGDAPYASSSGDNAVRHRVDDSFALAPVGSASSVSADGEPRLIDADDDNGVSIIGDLEPGFDSTLVINVTNGTGEAFQINGWFDWNANGVFESNELDVTVSSAQFGAAAQGQLTIPLQVPGNALVGETYARFRLFRPAENPLLGPAGEAASGEVEDYRIIVGNNPFQNPNAIYDGGGNNIGRYDVNNSGFVSAIDALQVINAMRRNGSQEIDLSNEPLPANLPAYPDVNGDGRISALDALNVINKLGDLQAGGEAFAASSQVASSFLSVGDGVLASAATVVDDQWIGRSETEGQDQSEQMNTIEPPAQKLADPQSSVFDQPTLIELDSIFDSIAEATLESRIVKLDSPLDQFFGSL